MFKKEVDDYIEQGIHGVKETNPEERREFLGTLRERIVIALTAPQVRVKHVQPEVELAIKEHKKAKLYVNGHIAYSEISKYIKVAQANNVSYTIVTNKDHNSHIGLVLAYDHAIDKENIYLNDQKVTVNEEVKSEKQSKKPMSFLKKWLKNK